MFYNNKMLLLNFNFLNCINIMKQYNDLHKLYLKIKNDIQFRLKDFEKIWSDGSAEDLYVELVFCLLTPQSKAKICWGVVEKLINKKLLFKGSRKDILKEVQVVRFKNHKTDYILRIRDQFFKDNKVILKKLLRKFNNTFDKREWLVENIKGIGYKEASHFLRNIGFGKNIAILDRHILKNLKIFNIIEEIPTTLSKNKYLLIEKKMEIFSNSIKIDLDHLDILLWYKETGEIFK